MMRKVVVLGSTGFIGSHLMTALSRDHRNKLCGLSSCDVDLTDSKESRHKLPIYLKNNFVVMASAITPDREDSLAAAHRNFQMASNLAFALSKNKAAYLLYLSSVDVYGRQNLKLPLTEKSPLRPATYYALSKLASELVLEGICAQKKIPCLILRLPGVYGPSDSHNSPIHSFVSSFKNKSKIIINGDGSQKRDFLYVDDLCTIISATLNKKTTGIFNAVTGKSYEISEILSRLKKIFGFSCPIAYRKKRKEIDLVFSKPVLFKKLPNLKLLDLESGLEETAFADCDLCHKSSIKYYNSKSGKNI